MRFVPTVRATATDRHSDAVFSLLPLCGVTDIAQRSETKLLMVMEYCDKRLTDVRANAYRQIPACTLDIHHIISRAVLGQEDDESVETEK
jgi:hypothetical protein